MKSSSHEFEMYVLVDNKPIKEYFHEGSVFVEGRHGSEYTIRLRNSTSNRACFILSVDGLNVLNGEKCSDNSPGYVIDGGDTLDVQCYKVDSDTGAKFVFGTKEDSYSAQIGEGTDNVGVIGARVFREKLRANYSVDPGWSYRRNKALLGSGSFSTGSFGHGTWASASAAPTRGIAHTSLSTQNAGTETYTSGGAIPDIEASLGTVFGDATEWKTEKVNFERASTLPDASLVVYYDSRKNLERRGIKFRKEVAPLPNPFPANSPGCKTPSGWRK